MQSFGNQAASESVVQQNNQEIIRLTPMLQADWRTHMTQTPRLLVTSEAICQSLDDLWEAYVS